MAEIRGCRQVGYFDCAGGGQVVVDGNYAYIGHMNAPNGTTIVDVSDPANPREVASLQIGRGLHSHKVRVTDGIMICNREILSPKHAAEDGERGGLAIFDVSNPGKPREITRWTTAGNGVHRFTFDGRYAYISPQVEGYVGNIVMILDMADPAKPKEVGRWWMPGQWIAGGETPTWKDDAHRCHHPIRVEDRLYVSYWHGGFVILDISDMSKPKMVSALDWSPPYPWPTHSCVPVPFKISGRRWMVVADEDVARLSQLMAPEMAAFMWMVDITDETRPMPVGTFQVDGVNGKLNPPQTGCHQPVETIVGNEVPTAWFANGLRIVDISNPHALKEAACYVPDPTGDAKRISSNDVFMDKRGLMYLIDRVRGMHIVERT